MSQDNKSSRTDEQKQQAEQLKAGREEKGAGTKSVEARIWAAANKLARADEEPFRENQESI
jgi:hypothetical protein